MAEETLFIIRNDIGGKYQINKDDSESEINYKKSQEKRFYATFNKDKNMWQMELPYWFVDSTNPNKCIQIESVSYFKPDGTADIGTTFHSPTLFDGKFNQFDYMVGLCSVGIYKMFQISSRCSTLEFFFRDYMNDENLDELEPITEQKKDEDGNLLYYTYKRGEESYVTEETNEDGSTNEPYTKQLQTVDGDDLYWIYKDLGDDVIMRIVEKQTYPTRTSGEKYCYPLVTIGENNKGFLLKTNVTMKYTTTPNNFPVLYEVAYPNNDDILYYDDKVNDMMFSVETYEVTDYPVMAQKTLNDDGITGLYYDESVIDDDYIDCDSILYLGNQYVRKYYDLTGYYMNNTGEVAENKVIDIITNAVYEEDVIGPLTYQVTDENGDYLYVKEGDLIPEETTEETNYPVTIEVEKPICFIIFTKLYY